MNKKVAIQGIKGSFHHQVAQSCFGENVALEECVSFREVITSVLDNTSQKAVMALENSIAGSILPNYSLLSRRVLFPFRQENQTGTCGKNDLLAKSRVGRDVYRRGIR